MGSKNDKEWITPKIKYLIAQTWKAHHSGRQVVRDQLAKKMEKKAKHKFNELKAKLSQTLMRRNVQTYI